MIVWVWFFNGVMLTVYGLMIGEYGVYELISGHTLAVVLAHLHAPDWRASGGFQNRAGQRKSAGGERNCGQCWTGLRLPPRR